MYRAELQRAALSPRCLRQAHKVHATQRSREPVADAVQWSQNGYSLNVADATVTQRPLNGQFCRCNNGHPYVAQRTSEDKNWGGRRESGMIIGGCLHQTQPQKLSSGVYTYSVLTKSKTRNALTDPRAHNSSHREEIPSTVTGTKPRGNRGVMGEMKK